MIISEETFYETYQPIKNHLDENASFNGCMFETFGHELQFVIAQPLTNIWTLIELDGQQSIVSGAHLVNRLGYFITAVPAKNGVDIQPPLDDL